VRREKQDPAGQQRRVVAVPTGADAVSCPVECLRAWLSRRGRCQEGPVFTRLDNPRPLRGLTGNAILHIVKQAVARIGLDARQYGAHSLRAGLITACGERGVSPLVIAAQSGHRSLDSLQRYFRPVDAFRSNACASLGL
jgi:integrase